MRDGRVAGLRSRAAATASSACARARAVALAAGRRRAALPAHDQPPGRDRRRPRPGGARRRGAGRPRDGRSSTPRPSRSATSPLSLVSEAVRGEGGVPARRRRPRASCSTSTRWPSSARATSWPARSPAGRPRPGADVVARHAPPRRRRRCSARFPTVAALCAEHGLDLARDPIPVTPAAHYAIGGRARRHGGAHHAPGPLRRRRVRGDRRARGQPARLQRAARGRGAGRRRGRAPWPATSDDWPEGPSATAGVARARRPAAAARRAPPSRRPCGAAWASSATPTGLADAAGSLAELSPTAPTPRPTTCCSSRGSAPRRPALRTESRGAHFRRDHPVPDPRQARRIAWVGGQPLTPSPPLARRARVLAMEAA